MPTPTVPAVSLITAHTGASTKPNELGMRPMQERVWSRRGEQYLLIKSPPASGKSRALMFVALDKLANQDVKQAIIVVPERSIGGSFADEALSRHGFWADWTVEPRWNLCNAPGADDPGAQRSKVKAVGEFLASAPPAGNATPHPIRDGSVETSSRSPAKARVQSGQFARGSAPALPRRPFDELDPGLRRGTTGSDGKMADQVQGSRDDEGEDYPRVLVCTHATFRFAFEELGVEAFDGRLVAIDEFHHVSVAPDNKLGAQLGALIARGHAHIVAMTGSYFRGDAAPVMSPEDEAKFETVTYTYYEQLNGYEHLKALDIRYCFYSGRYTDAIPEALDARLKTIVHIPNVNAKESLKDKIREAEEVMGTLGTWEGVDEATGFQLVRAGDGRLLRVADLVDDDGARRDRVIGALKNPAHRGDRDHVDVIIALGMAKEGFDWIWCEHALTVGYRSSLTEVVQIIGRATRDAPGKPRALFTNLIAEPDAGEAAVVDAVNDTLKAIAASLLMEQVLAPRFNFTPKNGGALDGFEYGEGGYRDGAVGYNPDTGQVHMEIKGLVAPGSDEARRICAEDLNEVITAFVQDKGAMERGMFDDTVVPEELTVARMGKIVRDRYPELSDEDQEAVRQHAVAALAIVQRAKEEVASGGGTALIDGIRRFAMDVRNLDIDLIDRINPFSAAYAVLAKAMEAGTLAQVAAAISAKRTQMSEQEALELTQRALRFKQEHGRLPAITSADAWERRMAEGVAAYQRHVAKSRDG